MAKNPISYKAGESSTKLTTYLTEENENGN